MIGFPFPAAAGQAALSALKKEHKRGAIKQIPIVGGLLDTIGGALPFLESLNTAAGTVQGLPALKSMIGIGPPDKAEPGLKTLKKPSNVKPIAPELTEEEMLSQILPFLGLGVPFKGR